MNSKVRFNVWHTNRVLVVAVREMTRPSRRPERLGVLGSISHNVRSVRSTSEDIFRSLSARASGGAGGRGQSTQSARNRSQSGTGRQSRVDENLQRRGNRGGGASKPGDRGRH